MVNCCCVVPSYLLPPQAEKAALLGLSTLTGLTFGLLLLLLPPQALNWAPRRSLTT